MQMDPVEAWLGEKTACSLDYFPMGSGHLCVCLCVFSRVSVSHSQCSLHSRAAARVSSQGATCSFMFPVCHPHPHSPSPCAHTPHWRILILCNFYKFQTDSLHTVVLCSPSVPRRLEDPGDLSVRGGAPAGRAEISRAAGPAWCRALATLPVPGHPARPWSRTRCSPALPESASFSRSHTHFFFAGAE